MHRQHPLLVLQLLVMTQQLLLEKEKLYDGRTRVAKSFVNRILKQRESRKLKKEEVELDEYDKKGIDKEIRKSA